MRPARILRLITDQHCVCVSYATAAALFVPRHAVVSCSILGGHTSSLITCEVVNLEGHLLTTNQPRQFYSCSAPGPVDTTPYALVSDPVAVPSFGRFLQSVLLYVATMPRLCELSALMMSKNKTAFFLLLALLHQSAMLISRARAHHCCHLDVNCLQCCRPVAYTKISYAPAQGSVFVVLSLRTPALLL